MMTNQEERIIVFDVFKNKHTKEILIDIALDLEEYTQDLLAPHAQIVFDLQNIETDEIELKVFCISIAAIIGKQFAVGSNDKRNASAKKFIKLYLNAITYEYKITLRELSGIYIERERTYKTLIDKCFSQHNSSAPLQLATTLYGYVFYPDDKPGDGIGPALVGYIYKSMVEGNVRLQGN